MRKTDPIHDAFAWFKDTDAHRLLAKRDAIGTPEIWMGLGFDLNGLRRLAGASCYSVSNFNRSYFSMTTRLRALTRSTSGTLRLVERFRRSLSLKRARKFIDNATGVFGFLTSAWTTA